MKAFAYLRVQIEKFLRRHGFVPYSEWITERDARNSAEVSVVTERRHHSNTRRERDEARAFINEKLQPLTMLEPVMEWPEPTTHADYVTEPFNIAHERTMKFVRGERRDIVVRVSIPAVFEYWNIRQDIRAIDEAMRFVAEAAAYKIVSTLRYGLTGDRG